MQERQKGDLRWRKAELHSHCSLDPVDYRMCDYSPKQLISEAARLGYEILAITCHNLDIWNRNLAEFAEGLGITLIPGMEVTVHRTRHVLVYNFRTGCRNLNRLDKIRARKREDTLVIAPHSFYPSRCALRHLLESSIDTFDALEISGFHTSRIDFNRRAKEIAGKYRRPLIGSGDIHKLWQLGRTYTWIYSQPGVVPILEAVKRGHVIVESSPLSGAQVAGWWGSSLWHCAFPANRRPKTGRLKPIYE